MANRESLQKALNANYDLAFFRQNVLEPVFGSSLTIYSAPKSELVNPSEEKTVASIKQYGEVKLTDYRQLYLYEVALAENVIVERNKVSIGAVIKRLIAGNNAVLVNFYYPHQTGKSWRLSFIAKEQVIDDGEIKKADTHAKRYTYVLGPRETCRTAAERFARLSLETDFTADKLKEAFSVEKLSEKFFEDYKYVHYSGFIQHITGERIVRKDKKDVFEKVQAPSNLFKVIFSKGKSEDDAKKDVRDFVKKLLGRIVFLYFVQKKGWLGASDEQWADGDANFLQNLFMASGQSEDFYYLWLRKLFYDTLNNPNRSANGFKLPDGKAVKIPYLNGGLFEDDDPNGILIFPPKLFADLFEFFNQYNFTIYEDSPDDHTVAVDPEMLGHIFENLLEDNKDKGAFYTPKEIVHYMCQESLIEYLCTKLNMQNTSTTTREDVERLIKHKEVSENIIWRAKEINRYLDELKICDPAIGSGAFPMGLLHEIFDAKQLLHQHCHGEGDFNAAEVKQNIIQNSIYGVDIEKGAVDIARLRFWLSLIVDEDIPRPLPNLDYKIVAGDSLLPKFEGEVVDIDWDTKTIGGKEAQTVLDSIQKGLKEIVKKQKQYFDAPEKDKMSLKAEIRNLKIDLLINQLTIDKLKYSGKHATTGHLFEKPKKDKVKELEIQSRIEGFKNTIKKLEQLKTQPDKPLQFFDWKLDFPEIMNPAIAGGNIGFDIVIANPPYIDSEAMVNTGNEELRIQISKKLSFTKGNWDIYIAFFDVGFSFLNQQGNLVYISPDKWISKPFGYELRKGLLRNFFSITEAGRKVFQNANVDSIITSIAKQNKPHLNILKFEHNKINKLALVDKNLLAEPFAFDWLFSENISLIRKIESFPMKLIDFGECKNACATSDAYKLKDYLIDINPIQFNPDNHLKVINTGTIGKYLCKWGSTPMTYLKDKYVAPVVNKKQFVKDFSNSYGFKSVKPKIIIKGLTLLDACYDVAGEIIPGKSTLIIARDKGTDLKFHLAFLNSKLPLFYIKEKYRGSSYNQGINFNTDMINLIPLPSISNDIISKFITKADQILFRKQANPQADTTALEQAIDNMVYKLYGLSYDEVLVVDKDFEKQMSRVEYEKLDYGFDGAEEEVVG